MRIAVTGATGFIGKCLCTRLASEGHEVRALVRRADHDLGAQVRIVRGALDDARALAEFTEGVDAVVHLAGAVRGIDRAAFDAVNVEGTRAVITALAACAPRAHFLLVSSLAAREAQLSDYAASKRAAEEVVTSASLASFTILRPTAVYGPGDVELQPLLEAMAGGWGTVPAAQTNRVTLIHVDDVVDAIRAALAHPGKHPEPFELCDAVTQGYDWPTLALHVQRRTGRRVRLLTVPRRALAFAGHLNRLAAMLTGRAPMLTPGKARELAHADWSCDCAPFARAFAWAPRIDLDHGLATVLEST